MKTYTLTKIKLNEGKDSLVHEGYETVGNKLSLFHYLKAEEGAHEINNISEVVEGKQVLLTSGAKYHNTSEIKKILTTSNNEITFETQTSIYRLTQKEE